MVKIGDYYINKEDIQGFSDIFKINEKRYLGVVLLEQSFYFDVYLRGGNIITIASKNYEEVKTEHKKLVSLFKEFHNV